jgi:hypothetical protein
MYGHQNTVSFVTGRPSVNAGGEKQEAMINAGAVRLLTKEAAVELYQAIHTAVYGDPSQNASTALSPQRN